MKGYEKIKELIEGELEDYSYFKIGELKWNDEFGNFDENNEDEHYIIEIEKGEKTKTLRFNYNRKSDKIEIEISEDNYEEICDFQHTIKYFWMALLEW